MKYERYIVKVCLADDDLHTAYFDAFNTALEYIFTLLIDGSINDIVYADDVLKFRIYDTSTMALFSYSACDIFKIFGYQ